MSLYRYGEFEKDIDFTDADFLDVLENARVKMVNRANNIPVTGKETDKIRKQNEIIDRFYSDIFGADAPRLMFGTSQSSMKRAEAYKGLMDLHAEQLKEVDSLTAAFRPNKQRR